MEDDTHTKDGGFLAPNSQNASGKMSGQKRYRNSQIVGDGSLNDGHSVADQLEAVDQDTRKKRAKYQNANHNTNSMMHHLGSKNDGPRKLMRSQQKSPSDKDSKKDGSEHAESFFNTSLSSISQNHNNTAYMNNIQDTTRLHDNLHQHQFANMVQLHATSLPEGAQLGMETKQNPQNSMMQAYDSETIQNLVKASQQGNHQSQMAQQRLMQFGNMQQGSFSNPNTPTANGTNELLQQKHLLQQPGVANSLLGNMNQNMLMQRNYVYPYAQQHNLLIQQNDYSRLPYTSNGPMYAQPQGLQQLHQNAGLLNTGLPVNQHNMVNLPPGLMNMNYMTNTHPQTTTNAMLQQVPTNGPLNLNAMTGVTNPSNFSDSKPSSKSKKKYKSRYERKLARSEPQVNYESYLAPENLENRHAICELAEALGFKKRETKTWRYRDLKRFLMTPAKMKPEHKDYIQTRHSDIAKRLPHKMTIIEFIKRMALLVFHFIVRDGKEPLFWTKISSRVKDQVFNDFLIQHDHAFFNMINRIVAKNAHAYIKKGYSVADAISIAQEQFSPTNKSAPPSTTSVTSGISSDHHLRKLNANSSSTSSSSSSATAGLYSSTTPNKSGAPPPPPMMASFGSQKDLSAQLGMQGSRAGTMNFSQHFVQ